eukprot:1464591-Rhodomonas_salina.2
MSNSIHHDPMIERGAEFLRKKNRLSQVKAAMGTDSGGKRTGASSQPNEVPMELAPPGGA